jgi:hypothetical protein
MMEGCFWTFMWDTAMFVGRRRLNWHRSGQLLLALAMFADLSTVPSTATNVDDGEWQYIMHQHELGDCKLFLGKHYVKIACTASDFITVSDASRGYVVRYRTADKLEWRAKTSAIWGLNIHRTIPEPKDLNLQWTKCGSRKIAGMNCSRWIANGQADRIFWLSDEMNADPNAIEVICRTFRLPITPKVPIRVERQQYTSTRPSEEARTKHGTWSLARDFDATWYDSASVEIDSNSFKKVPFKIADFKEPQGFKTVSSPNQLILNKQQTNELVDMLDGIGFATDKKKITVPKAPRVNQ